MYGSCFLTRVSSVGTVFVTAATVGDEIDEGGDPPRVWSAHGDYPGTAFTRSIGDRVAEECGVNAEPEILERCVLRLICLLRSSIGDDP